jgi:hypothetical protein
MQPQNAVIGMHDNGRPEAARACSRADERQIYPPASRLAP